jgi:hypothetical protein
VLPSVSLRWSARGTPLAPCGLIARAEVARALARLLLAWPEERLAALQGCAGDQAVALLGAPETLPWVDGVCYLGRDPHAPGLLVPTSRVPGVPMDLFAAALAARLPGGPWAVGPRAPDGLTAVSLAAAGPLSRVGLASWLEQK